MDEYDKELIDRGFAFVAKAVYIEAATRALMGDKQSDHGVREWARWILEELPKREVKNDEQTG